MSEATIKIRTSDGSYGTVAAKDLSQALAADAEVVSDEEFGRAQLQKEYGGVGGTAAALGLGAARGATLGVSDIIASELGGESTRNTIRAYQEANPVASIGGEVVGALAPLLVSGGTSAAVEGAEGASLVGRGVRGAGSLVRGVDALGGVAERGVARLVGTQAESILGRGLQRGLALGARGAVEGAAYGAFQQLDEDVLGDKEVSAQKLFSAAEKGALFGGLLSGGLGFAGGALTRGAQKGAGAISKRLGQGTVGEFLERKSADFAFSAAGGGKRIATKAERYAGGTEAVGRIWRDEGPSLIGRAVKSREDLAEVAVKGMAREGDGIKDILRKADDLAIKAGKSPTVGDLLADVERVKASVASHAGQEPLVARLDDFAESMKRLTGAVSEDGTLNLNHAVSFEQWQALRRDADKMWGEAAKGGKTVFLDLRGEMEKSLVSKLEGVGGDVKAYTGAKKKWQAFKLLSDATANDKAASASNRFWSLTDHISGAAGSAVGGLVGGLPGALIGSAVGGALNRLVRKEGDFVMMNALKRLSATEQAQAVTRMVDTRIEKAISGLLTRTKSAGIGLASKAVSSPEKSKRDDIQVLHAVHALASNPDLLQRNLESHAGDLHSVSPAVAAQYGAVASRALAYLASVAPKSKASVSSLQPHLENPFRMSSLERAKWRGSVRGVFDTMDVIDDLGSGKVDRYAIEAIKEFAPHVFAKLQDEVDRQSEDLAAKLPLQKQAALSRAFGVPVGSMFTPEAIAAYQATYAPMEAAKEGMPTPDMESSKSNVLKSPTEEIATNDNG